MLNAVCFVPATPLLVPRMGGAAAAETEELRRAVLAAVGSVAGPATAWTVLETGPVDSAQTTALSGAGSFGAYGLDEPVWFGPGAAPEDPTGPRDRTVALPGLIAGWLRGELGAQAELDLVQVPVDAEPAQCAQLGAELDERFADEKDRRIVLVVADGPDSLTPQAPGALHPDAAAVDAVVAEAIASGDHEVLAGLDTARAAEVGLEGRAPWQAAAALATARAARTVVPMISGYGFHCAPYGVGYHVGVWRW